MTDSDLWPNIQGGKPIWKHSDINEMPYVHIYKVFNKITGKDQGGK